MLDQFRVASACSANWESMKGDDQVRFCGECKKHVYNLSAMTRRDAESLLSSGESICGRYYQRSDGTILTEDCPVGLREKAARVRRRVSFAISGWIGIAAAFAQTPQSPDRPVQVEQATSAELRVILTDATGAGIPGASITLLDEKTQSTISGQSNQAGEYRFVVARGVYTVQAQAPGFTTFQRPHTALDANSRIEITMNIGALMGEVVEIRKSSFLHKLRRLL
jgi:Carboxypeptidase regulatory-like domain